MPTLSDRDMDRVLVPHFPGSLVLCALFFTSCLPFAGAAASAGGARRNTQLKPGEAKAAPEKGMVAGIGASGMISELDLADFSAAESCYGPDAINSRKAGFMRMLEATVGEEALRRDAGTMITPGDYEAEIERVDRDTRAPEILGCIKKHFGFDPDSGKFRDAEGRNRYKRVFLRKYIVQARVFRFTRYDPKIQKEAYRMRDAVSSATARGESFSALAGKYGFTYSTHSYALEERKEASSPAGAAGPSSAMAWSPFEKQFIEEHLAALKPGGMKREPIESADDIQFVRLLSVTDGGYYFESLRINKKDDYFRTAPKLRGIIKDEELKKWILGMPGNPMVSMLQLD